ncbi:MAG: hypothetical protein ACNFW9_05660 [Candidatus Kerfeldbacteria bacterium]|jgi:hypothetical protein
MSTSTCEHYQHLIKFIRDKLEKKKESTNELRRVKHEDERPMYGLRYTSFGTQLERTMFVDGLVEEINKVDEFLHLVAGRHHERHKELVSLLVEQFEIENELETKKPKFAAGFLHEQNSRLRLDEIKSRIEVIISDKEVD